MAKKKLPAIEIGYQAFAKGAEEEFGAVRRVTPQEIIVYVEDAGDTTIPLAAVTDVIEGKVIIDVARLPDHVQAAIAKAHRDEDYP